MQVSELYASVTNEIVKALESGNLQPWKCPWTRDGSGFPLRHSGIAYRGVNVLLLWMISTLKGYSSPYFMTFQQARDYGGMVKKGEKSATILFCQPMTKDSTAEDGKKGKDSFWMARAYHVFNVAQIEGLPDRFTARPLQTLDPAQRIEHADTFIANTKADIEHAGQAAYYSKISDRITLPPFETFHSPEGYYSTACHELHHWAGITHRLNRFTATECTREEYAREEIVAELAATMTTAQLGFDHQSHADHAAYLDHWIKALKADPRYLFQAASKAQASCDYLNGLQPFPPEGQNVLPIADHE